MAEKQVRRKRYTTDNILKNVKLKPPYDEIYNEKAINIIGEEVLNTLADFIKEGYAVDFGLGRCYLKLRRNNAILNDKAKSMSLVFRGEVKDKIQEEIIDKCYLKNELFKTYGLYNSGKEKDE